MKIVKGISLFFLYPLVMLGLGFWCGICTMQFFYPGMSGQEKQQEYGQSEYEWPEYEQQDYQRAATDDVGAEENMAYEENLEESGEDLARGVAVTEETLNADTEYVLLERDLLRETVVETMWQLPGKYIGMTRELFLSAMEEYAQSPPLSEKERGFIGLEVISFSPKRVVVQMNYKYVQPSESFYLAVQDNEIVALLEDRKTVFINTGILLEEVPEAVQMKIMQMYFMENEQELYNFLETYSS